MLFPIRAINLLKLFPFCGVVLSQPKINFKKPSLVRIKRKGKTKIYNMLDMRNSIILHLLLEDHCAHDSTGLFHFICINSCLTSNLFKFDNIDIRVILLKHFTYFFSCILQRKSKARQQLWKPSRHTQYRKGVNQVNFGSVFFGFEGKKS